MRDPYSLIRELIFLYKGKDKKTVEKKVIEAFKENYNINLVDLGIPYEELVYYIVNGKEDEAYEFLEKYLYHYLLEEYERRIRAEDEFQRIIGGKILDYFKKRGIRFVAGEDVIKYIDKLLEENRKLSKKLKELQEKSREAEKYAKKVIDIEKIENILKPLKDEIEKLKNIQNELINKINEMLNYAKIPELNVLKKSIEDKKKIIEEIDKKIEKIFGEESKEYILYKRLKEKILFVYPEELMELYVKIKELYPGFSKEFYTLIKDLIKTRFKELNIPICPVHDSPLVRVNDMYECYLGKEKYLIKEGVPIPIPSLVTTEKPLPIEIDPIPEALRMSRVYEIPVEIKERICDILNTFIKNYDTLARRIFEKLKISFAYFDITSPDHIIIYFIKFMKDIEAPLSYLSELQRLLYSYIQYYKYGGK